jgi:hypothetical protein
MSPGVRFTQLSGALSVQTDRGETSISATLFNFGKALCTSMAGVEFFEESEWRYQAQRYLAGEYAIDLATDSGFSSVVSIGSFTTIWIVGSCKLKSFEI